MEDTGNGDTGNSCLTNGDAVKPCVPVVFEDHAHLDRASAPQSEACGLWYGTPRFRACFCLHFPVGDTATLPPPNLGSTQGSHPSRHNPPNEELEFGPGNQVLGLPVCPDASSVK